MLGAAHERVAQSLLHSMLEQSLCASLQSTRLFDVWCWMSWYHSMRCTADRRALCIMPVCGGAGGPQQRGRAEQGRPQQRPLGGEEGVQAQSLVAYPICIRFTLFDVGDLRRHAVMTP